MPEQAVVLLSGGQDSTTCLAWAIDRWGVDNIDAISFDYGQRHAVELNSALEITRLAGLKILRHHIMKVPGVGISALTSPFMRFEEGPDGLPTSFLPGRNILFLTLAAQRAYGLGIDNLVGGMCQTDYSGYPDCREEFITAMTMALKFGLSRPKLKIHTPLMNLTKAQSIRLMQRFGHLDWLAHTQTCYEGYRPPCGTCPACVIRAKGFLEAGVPDPLLEVKS